MYVGLLVSVLMHATLLGWTVFSIQSIPELRAPSIEAVAVDMITPSELTRLTKGSRDAKLKEARPKEGPKADPTPKEAPRPRLAAAPPPPPPPEPPAQAPETPTPPPPPPKVAAPPPPPPPPAVEPPKPEPDKAALEQKLADLALQQAEEAKRQAEAKAKVEADAKSQADAEAKSRAEAEVKAKAEAEAEAKARAEADAAKAKAEADARAKKEAKRRQDEKLKAAAKERERKRLAADKEKSKLDVDKLSALLDKTPNARAPAPAAPETKSDTRAKGPVLGAPEGRDAVLSASARAMLGQLMRESVRKCWNINAGLDGIDKIGVRIEMRLNRDGSLSDPPKVLNSASGPLFRDMADSALRAVVACAPYALPPDMYEGGWDHMIMNFDPSQMF